MFCIGFTTTPKNGVSADRSYNDETAPLISVYANYIEGLSAGPVTPVGTSNVGSSLQPIQSKQFETGVKVDFGRITTTLALFQITQPFAITQNTVFQLGGEQRNRGIEFNVFGR